MEPGAPARVRIVAATSRPRHAVVAELGEALNGVGWIVDVRLFSNAALTLLFELPASRAGGLRAALEPLRLGLSDESVAALRKLERARPESLPDPLPGSVHVTFFHGDPDLRIPVPAVPG